MYGIGIGDLASVCADQTALQRQNCLRVWKVEHKIKYANRRLEVALHKFKGKPWFVESYER